MYLQQKPNKTVKFWQYFKSREIIICNKALNILEIDTSNAVMNVCNKLVITRLIQQYLPHSINETVLPSNE